MAGCAATGCHGRPTTRPGTLDADTWHESFTLWIDRDPHTRSYAVLEGSLAQAIMKHLHEADPSVPLDATRDARCLACHTTPSLAGTEAMKADGLNRLRAEGVSCEACHGNAEKWQIAHTNPIPPDRRTDILHAWQMNDLNDWHVQAKTCAGCHIGAGADQERGLPVRDMNHDMIAAGHPRLEFDFPTYHAKLSPHWLPRDRNTGQPQAADAMLHAWLNGQIAVDETSCELSLDRIYRGNREARSPYPEFADWNCSQCHHNLVPVTWRERVANSQTMGNPAVRRLGQPVWIGASTLLPDLPMPFLGEKTDALKTKLTDRKQRLVKLEETVRKNPSLETRRIIEEMLARPENRPANWEDASRSYLALQSLEFSLKFAKVSTTEQTNSLFAQFRNSLWGSPDVPPRRERVGAGYQRKPESRWKWENEPNARPDGVDATILALRKSLLADLKKLPIADSKP